MSLIRLGLALLLLVATASQSLQHVQGRRKMCGEGLIRELNYICVKGFPTRVKRSTSVPKDRVRTLIRKLQDTESEKDPSGSNGSKRKLRRHRRNIAHECCKDGCTLDDILDYCAV
ncbi:probable insulin-like peptide 4 isoform X2 [Drosophila subpulchrella]|uniref:probable insulin-like peptide 4 isoform X2 n=1 Tax=Drosophila subpulchrella TaxID=1486046 RepID=UPI0018A1969B|nr:probable insulin-like peptide 4 isoform X2 [Drosophila subpulchrella]